MNCSNCGRPHGAGARFCGGCGKPLAPRCPVCGVDAKPDAQFCESCGSSLAARPEASRAPIPAADEPADAAARKVVTIVFADLVGSTALHERLDAESVRRFMDRYYRAMQTAVESHGGVVTQLLGDGVKAVFGAPRVAEDDAIRAVRAAVAMQQRFRELANEQSGAVGKTGLRVAVNTGEVIASENKEIIGDPVNVAARLQEQGRDGDVVIGESTRRLVSELVTLAPLGTFALKGRAETVAAYRVVSLDRPAGVATTAFVGRDGELRRLIGVYETAVTTRRARLAAILGSPGLGKSRLVAELARRLGDAATVLSAHCDAAGGATFAPLAEALRAVLHIDEGAGSNAARAAIDAVVPGDESERNRIAGGVSALLAGTPASPEETFFVVRRLLAALAAAQPVVLVIDDVQWAEPLLLDLVEHLVQWTTDATLLVLVAARPELRDTRSSLTAVGGLVSEVVTLGGLDAGAATRLAANVVGAGELPAAVAGRVLAASEGNPLFVGELVRMLVQDGALKQEGDRWIAGAELAAIEMPPTIHALLAARIERLKAEERVVLERAAVIGRQFSRAAVAHLLPAEASNLDARLEALRRSELVESDTGWFLGEPALRFHHVLIRDAAYRRVLKGTRAELHARVGDWIQGRVGESVEHDETIGWHLEQAHQHLRELGPIDASGRALGERASRHLAAAGRRALARDDLSLASGLLGRALDRLDPDDPARADLALDWCEALLAAGDVGPAAGAIDELARFTGTSERLQAWHTCFVGQRAALTDPQALRATADTVAAAAGTLATLNDSTGEAKAHFVHAVALQRLGKVGACEAALDHALAAARRAGDRRRSNAVLAGAPLAALWGPSPVTRASGRCLDVVRVLRITQGAPAVEAVALRCQGVLEALRGRTEAARRMVASSRRMVEELGIIHRLLEADMFAGLIELLEGDAAAAETSLRAAYEGLKGQGLGIDAAQAAALLGRALLAQRGRATEAEALSYESEALAGDDLQAAIAWRGVRAEALARRGEHGTAVEFARAAVNLAAATDALLHHADARLALAAALRAAGRSDDAAAEEARAIELWEAKGATLLAERARREPPRTERTRRASLERGKSVRRVDANVASANLGRLVAAFAARDSQAIDDLLAERVEAVHHPTAGTYDRTGLLTSYQSMLKVHRPDLRHEVVATLGNAVALCHMYLSAGGFAGQRFDVAAYDREEFLLVEVDADGRQRRVELFASDKLSDAVVRLYERYAELLPEGFARERAAATARSVDVALRPFDDDRIAAAMHPTIEFVDHRLLGLPPTRGAEALLLLGRTQYEAAEAVEFRVDDILDLRPDALLIQRTTSGTDRSSGGAYERPCLRLLVFGADGRWTRVEHFEIDRAAEALARFDELTIEPPSAQVTTALRVARESARRVRSNAAVANGFSFQAAVAARDLDAFATLLADDAVGVDHPNGAVLDRSAILLGWRRYAETPGFTTVYEPLATLGESLALCRHSFSASGATGRLLDVGPYELERIALIEVDAQGRRKYAEFFAADRLGDAVIRLYERYAEILPDGPERDRAAATARSVAALPLVGGYDLDRCATAFAPDIEYVDHRTVGLGSLHGPEAVLQAVRALLELSEEFATRLDDILAVRSDAFLVHWTDVGTDRASGGPFERRFCHLFFFGIDGLLKRTEQFDADREDEAFARFDQLTAGSVASRPAAAPSRAAEKRERRLRPNAATANAVRIVAAMERHDVDALYSLLAEDMETVHHPTGTIFGREGNLAGMRSLLASRNLTFRLEPLATIGDTLALFLHPVSVGEMTTEEFDVGALENDQILLSEVDEEGRGHRIEFFALDKLGDAVIRLYERYAELLPEGPTRARAATTAASLGIVLGAMRPGEPDIMPLAPSIEFVDHRSLGFAPTGGKKDYLLRFRTLFELATDITTRTDDVLALRPDALLVRWTHRGTERIGGGAYERHLLMLWVFGADGLAVRNELFDADCEDRALARFDELSREAASAQPAPAPALPSERVERRVRPNAATAHTARVDAAIAAGNAAALDGLLADGAEIVDHTLGVTYDNQGLLLSWRSLLSAREPALRHQPLATLGDFLALCRLSTSARGFAGKTFDVGAYERQEITVVEVDAVGRRLWSESVANDRLGDGVARLYERYAELLPDGPARVRAAATARSVAVFREPPDPDRWGGMFASDVAYADHRAIGFPSARGVKKALLDGFRVLFELAADVATRIDDILALRSDALLVRLTMSGNNRDSGGAFEQQFLNLTIFGADGLVAHLEQFDVEQAAEALVRFDELTAAEPVRRPAPAPIRPAAKPRRRVRPNAATANTARIGAAVVARDAEAIADLMAEGSEFVEHPTAVVYDRDKMLFSYRSLLAARDPSHRYVPLATLGDSLALCRSWISASGSAGGRLDVGPYQKEEIALVEVDANGRQRRGELFAVDHLGDAVARLYERYAELFPDEPARSRAAATARSVAMFLGSEAIPNGWPAALSCLAPGLEFVDRRTLGFGSLHGAEAFERLLRSLAASADNIIHRVEDVLDLRPNALLVHSTNSGTDRVGGGDYQRVFLQLLVFDDDGAVARWEHFDVDRRAEALARFDELTGEQPSTTAFRIENAATRFYDRFEAACEARDLEGIAACMAPNMRHIDRRASMQLDLDRGQHLEWMHSALERTFRTSSEVVATRGDRLALARVRSVESDEIVGPSEHEFLGIVEVNDRGECVAGVLLDPDDLAAAYAELDARYNAGEGAPYAAKFAPMQRLLSKGVSALNSEHFAALLAPDFVVQDHSPLGWGTLDRQAYLQSLKALVDLAPDTRIRADHLWRSERGTLGVGVVLGTREGGAFEQPRVTVSELDFLGRECRRDIYSLDQFAEAKARFDSLTRSTRAGGVARDQIAALLRPNAATKAMDRLHAAFEARDWPAMRAAYAPGAKLDDRRRFALVSTTPDELLRDFQNLASARDARYDQELLGTAGERIALERVLVTGGPKGGRFEIGFLWLIEVDERGLIVAGLSFDLDDWRAAFREAHARWLAHDPAVTPAIASGLEVSLELSEALNDRDRRRLRAVLADDVVVHDHRPARLGIIEGADAYVEAAAAWWALAPDLRIYGAQMLATEAYGSVALVNVSGTLPEGGSFEGPMVGLSIMSNGKIGRLEMWDVEHVDAALARFAELRPDPLRIPPNAATRINLRWRQYVEARDWDALRGLIAPVVWEDRRRLVRTTGDCGMLLASEKLISGTGTRRVGTLLATAGDRLFLQHLLWRGAFEGQVFEVEYLEIVEIDAENRVVACIAFDADNHRAAHAELLDRYARSDAGQWMTRGALEFLRAIDQHDLKRLGAALADDFVMDDHRRTGLGRLENTEDYLASVATLFELSPDVTLAPLYYVEVAKHGYIALMRMFGTRAGGDLENFAVGLQLWSPSGDRVRLQELFEVEDLERARARFAELRPDPLRIPPNAATRTRDRAYQALVAQDWEAMRAVTSADFRFEDRGKRALVSGGVDEWIGSIEFLRSEGGQFEGFRTVSTAGERLALDSTVIAGAPAQGGFEIHQLILNEVDADGKLKTVIRFDPGDRRAAASEMLERFMRSDAAAMFSPTSAEIARALNAHDLERMRAVVPDGFVLYDHRRVGLGRVDKGDYIASVAALFEQSPDVTVEVLYFVAVEKHGVLLVTRNFGTLREGGEFESVVVQLGLSAGDHVEWFEIEDLDRARARFEELRPGPQGP